MAKPRNIMRIELSERTHRNLPSLNERFGMTHLSMNSKAMEWFAAQDQATQKAIMTSDGASPDIAKTIVRKMAGQK